LQTTLNHDGNHARLSRSRARCDVEALARAVVDFSLMIARLGDRLVEAEINPLFVLPEGRGVRAADGVAVLREGAVIPS
jgi:hypothetical protein